MGSFKSRGVGGRSRQGWSSPGGAVMLGVNLALIVLLGQAPTTPDPSELVARLGSPRYVEREEAAGALERLGRLAIPALRAAREARDAEIRTRAAALFNKIEG